VQGCISGGKSAPSRRRARSARPDAASFSDPDRALPLGLQVTVIGSPDDFLVKLRDLMLSDPSLRRDYKRC